jgi:putative transposase
LSTTQERYAFTVFEQVFKEFGLPRAIRTDNGVPFSCTRAIERIRPGHPQQNGRHERMHLTLKKEATCNPLTIRTTRE